MSGCLCYSSLNRRYGATWRVNQHCLKKIKIKKKKKQHKLPGFILFFHSFLFVLHLITSPLSSAFLIFSTRQDGLLVRLNFCSIFQNRLKMFYLPHLGHGQRSDSWKARAQYVSRRAKVMGSPLGDVKYTVAHIKNVCIYPSKAVFLMS